MDPKAGRSLSGLEALATADCAVFYLRWRTLPEDGPYPQIQPVAWTKTYTGDLGHTARVFFTTLGHPQ